MEEELASSADESVEEQLRAAVEKGDVDQLRRLLRGSEGSSELAPLLRLACARAETGAHRAELVELLLEKGADPSAVGDGGSALWLAVAQGTNAIVSTLLEKATPGQRVAAARTLCEKGAWALDARKAAGKGLEPEAKAWLEQAQRVADVPLDAAPGSRVQLSGDGTARTLVRRAEGGWFGEGGTACDLADVVLGQYPLAVSISTACQWHSMCDTCGQATTHAAQCEGTVYSYQYVQPPSASEGALPPPTASVETLREAGEPAASGNSAAEILVRVLEAGCGPDCIWLDDPPPPLLPPLRWSCPAGWECDAPDQNAAFAAHNDACERRCGLEELEIICPLASGEPEGAAMDQQMAGLEAIGVTQHASGHTMEQIAARLGVPMQEDDAAAPAPATAAPAPPSNPPAGAIASLWRCLCGWKGNCASAEAAAAAHSAAKRESCPFAPLKAPLATYYHCGSCDWGGESRARHGRSKGCTNPAVRSFSYPKHMTIVSCATCVASEGGGALEPWCEAGWQALAAHAKRGCTHTPMVTELPGLRKEALARHRTGEGAPRGVVLERDAEGRPTRERVTLTHVSGDGGGQALRHDGARIPLTAAECTGKSVGDAIEIDLGAFPGRVPSKQRMSAWEAKRQAEQVKEVLEELVCELERSEPPRQPTSGQALHGAVLQRMLPGLEGLEGLGSEKARQLMQARVTPTLALTASPNPCIYTPLAHWCLADAALQRRRPAEDPCVAQRPADARRGRARQLRPAPRVCALWPRARRRTNHRASRRASRPARCRPRVRRRRAHRRTSHRRSRCTLCRPRAHRRAHPRRAGCGGQ